MNILSPAGQLALDSLQARINNTPVRRGDFSMFNGEDVFNLLTDIAAAQKKLEGLSAEPFELSEDEKRACQKVLGIESYGAANPDLAQHHVDLSKATVLVRALARACSTLSPKPAEPVQADPLNADLRVKAHVIRGYWAEYTGEHAVAAELLRRCPAAAEPAQAEPTADDLVAQLVDKHKHDMDLLVMAWREKVEGLEKQQDVAIERMEASKVVNEIATILGYVDWHEGSYEQIGDDKLLEKVRELATGARDAQPLLRNAYDSHDRAKARIVELENEVGMLRDDRNAQQKRAEGLEAQSAAVKPEDYSDEQVETLLNRYHGLPECLWSFGTKIAMRAALAAASIPAQPATDHALPGGEDVLTAEERATAEKWRPNPEYHTETACGVMAIIDRLAPKPAPKQKTAAELADDLKRGCTGDGLTHAAKTALAELVRRAENGGGK